MTRILTTQANPDKPKVVVLRLFKSAFKQHRSMAEIIRNEAQRKAWRARKARKLRIVADAWATVSPNAFKE